MPFDPERLSVDRIATDLSSYGVAELAAIIEQANREYWDLQDPRLPDPLYDELVEQLRTLDPAHPLLSAMGPAAPEDAGQAAEELAKTSPQERFGSAVRHRRPMLSLEKCYDAQELYDWVQKRGGEVLVMPKMDGVAASLIYGATGELQVAATRGSGQVGEDITARILEIPQVPKTLKPAPGHPVEVRGEVYMRRSIFDANYAEDFSHPRNLTAGSLKRKDASSGARSEDLSFYAYDLDGLSLAHESQKIDALVSFGFDSPDAKVIQLDAVKQSVQDHTSARESLDYEVDGIVYRVADTQQYSELGATGHHPRGAIAYKFQGVAVKSTLRDIEWSVSRTGAITPVAIFDEVLVDGANLTRASLHNLQRFESMQLGHEATLEITRRGGVIPMVQRALTHGDLSRPFQAPDHCPACPAPVERVKRRDGEFLFCSSPSTCSVSRLRELEHFAKVLDMMGFGPKFLELAFDAGLLTNIEDFFTLSKDALTSLERIGDKTAQNLLDEVQKARSLELSVFLRSLGITHLGRRNAQRISQAFQNLKAVRSASAQSIMDLPGFQETMAEAITTGLVQRAALIDKLLTHIEVQDAAPESTQEAEVQQSELTGKSVLFTGTLTAMPRNQAEACLPKVGASAAKGVNQKLDILVIGQGKGAMSSKEKKARALIEQGASLEILDEETFWQRMPPSLRPKAD